MIVMDTDLCALQLRLRADALDRIRRGYALVESGMTILAVLSIPEMTNTPTAAQSAIGDCLVTLPDRQSRE